MTGEIVIQFSLDKFFNSAGRQRLRPRSSSPLFNRKGTTVKFNDQGMENTWALLARLKSELPEVCEHARVVGKWVWLKFNGPPLLRIRIKLKQLGFHWNDARKCWQHPCGVHGSHVIRDNPQLLFPPFVPGSAIAEGLVPAKGAISVKEYKVISLRECPLPQDMHLCDSPQKMADYWRLNVATNPYFNPDCECFVVLLLNTRRRVKGHQLLTFGTMDTLLVHPREVFRGAIIAGASAIVMAHNLCAATHKLCYVHRRFM
jgi:hypothetical protein